MLRRSKWDMIDKIMIDRMLKKERPQILYIWIILPSPQERKTEPTKAKNMCGHELMKMSKHWCYQDY